MAATWSLVPLVTQHASVDPEQCLAIDGERTWTYRQVEADASALAAAWLELGLGAGDRIAIHLPNGIEWIVALLAAARLGAVVVPVNPQLHIHALRFQLRQAEVSAVLTMEQWSGVDHLEQFESLLAELPSLQYVVVVGTSDLWFEDRVFRYDQLLDRGTARATGSAAIPDDDQPLAVLYTAGTMGKPKSVELTHRALVESSRQVAVVLGYTPADRVLVLGSFASALGLSALLGTLGCGGTLVLQPVFASAEALVRIAAAGATVLHGAPTHFDLLMREEAFDPSRLRSLRTGLMAGMPVTEAFVRRVRRWCDVELAYGLTETGAHLSMTRPTDRLADREQSVGTPLPGVEVMAVDVISGQLHGPEAVGEIAVRGPNVMRGYLRQPSGTAAVFTPEGFFLTGDLGILDEVGRIRLLGRRQETISRGGHPVQPQEIEERLRAHPAVHDVCVISVPHEVLGELLCACVVAAEEAVLTGDDIRRFASRMMTAEMVPDLVRFFEAFPLTGSGTVRRRELARAIALGVQALERIPPAPAGVDSPLVSSFQSSGFP